MSPVRQALSEYDRRMIAEMPGATTCYVDLVMLDPDGEFAGWEHRATEIFLERDLDYERIGRHLCVLQPAACVAWVEERERKYARMLAAGYRMRVNYHWNEFEHLPPDVFDAMRRDLWRGQQEERSGKPSLTARQREAETIKAAIASCYGPAPLAAEAGEVRERLGQEYDVEIEQDAQESAVYRVSRYGLPWLDYHAARQAFRLSGARWPWEDDSI